MDINSGYLELFIGPMFSGKTTSLLRELYKYKDIGYKVCLIRHTIDNRPKLSHSSQELKNIIEIKTKDLNVDVSMYEIIGIDEVQFFNEIEKIKDLVDIQKKIVFCSGLDGDFNRRPFGRVLELVPLADKVTKLTAKCHKCIEDYKNTESKFGLIKDSPFTHKKIKNDIQVEIGAEDLYISLCRYHYLNSK